MFLDTVIVEFLATHILSKVSLLDEVHISVLNSA
jgi:hypothetical protein